MTMLQIFFLLFVFGSVKSVCPAEELSLAPLLFTRPENISLCEEPYLNPNCRCPSSMFECDCHKLGLCKNRSGCIPISKVNNRVLDCTDKSDELSNICLPDRFQCDCFNTTCRGSYGCVNTSFLCDGRPDCLDGSDEDNCPCAADQGTCACHKTRNCTTRINCIPYYFRCNGINECGDWSDEENCTCASYMFECPCYKTRSCGKNYRGCVPKDMQVCDGRNNCGDWSDEVNCNCSKSKFECDCFKTKNCTFDYDCIPKKWMCDGINHCGDWSDERNCSCPANQFECQCYKTGNCPERFGCVSKKYQCTNTAGICGDKSDGFNCTCPTGQFTCACVGTKQCIGREGSCVDRSLLCDGHADCFDGSDEFNSTCYCSGVFARCPCYPNNKTCSPAGQCLPFDWVGDTFLDCHDGSDEVCSISTFSCQSCTVVAVSCQNKIQVGQLIHSTVAGKCNKAVHPSCANSVHDCKTDKVVCTFADCKQSPSFCEEVFFCENNTQIISSSFFCNSANDCGDHSDEIREGFGFKCSGSSREGDCVLPQANVYDSVAQCSDKSDLCFTDKQFKCFRCLDKKLIISLKQVCDGVIDCHDMSDECLCSNQSLCNSVKGNCPPNQILCQNGSKCVNQTIALCNRNVQCASQTNTKSCMLPKRLQQTQCPAEITNDLKIDEIFRCAKNDNRLLRKKFQYYRAKKYNAKVLFSSICDGTYKDRMGGLGETACPNMFYCAAKDEISIKQSQVCDGKLDCDDKSDEFLSRCQDKRFYCQNQDRISINRNSVCDGIVDCDNGTDEIKCLCNHVRFYCTNKQPLSVEMKLVQNGIQDCSDGSDECVNLAGDAFANVNEMIGNVVYRVIFWITGVLALGGNLLVFIATVYSLYNAKRTQNVFINTNVFILNLSVSDFLMGVYLLAVVIQGTRFSGSYCLFDKAWRSSSLCSGLGALAVLSSQSSALTMTAMTTFRLVSIYKPFLTQSLDVGPIILTELLCWISAIMLATVPVLNVTSDYFISDVWFPNNFFGTDFVSRENMSLLAKRIFYTKPKGWSNVKRTISKAFPRHSIQGEFGYYGKTSVCMPRLFATTSEFAWEYSTFLITIDFLMFIYMVVAYVVIYKKSNKMKGSKSTDVSPKMQKRITRLILTDFCCWIPVCIMGYLSVAGIRMPPDAYVLSACLLLPINSALNPIIYSKVIEQRLFIAKKWLGARTRSMRSSTNQSSVSAVTHSTRGTEANSNRVIEMSTATT